MRKHIPTFTERRRTRLARRVDRLEEMEGRNLITEPINFFAAGLGLPTAISMVLGPSAGQTVSPRVGQPLRSAAKSIPAVQLAGSSPSTPTLRIAIVPPSRSSGAAGWSGAGNDLATPETSSKAAPATPGGWLTLSPGKTGASGAEPLFASVKPSQPLQTGGGNSASVMSPAGTAVGTRGGISPLRFAAPPSSSAASSALLSAAGGAGSAPAPAGTSPGIPSPNHGAIAAAAPPPASLTSLGGAGGVGGLTQNVGVTAVPENAWSLPYAGSSPLAPLSFPYFAMYTLDYDNGVILFPGQYQQATLGGSVDLRAQVRDTTVSTYSWDTSHLTHATGITGSSTYRLQFSWNAHNSTAAVDYATLTITNNSSQQEMQTYYFQVPTSNVVTLPSSSSWPESLSPDTVRAEAPAFDSHNVSVDANSGALDTTLALPAYNPNVPALSLTYDSLAADPRPIIVEHHTIDPALAIPSQVSAQLTFNGTAGTTWYYNTSQFIPGDVQQIALQANATSLATGRYSYSDQVIDYRTTNTTTTISGTATVLNDSGERLRLGLDAPGAGEDHDGHRRRDPGPGRRRTGACGSAAAPAAAAGPTPTRPATSPRWR